MAPPPSPACGAGATRRTLVLSLTASVSRNASQKSVMYLRNSPWHARVAPGVAAAVALGAEGEVGEADDLPRGVEPEGVVQLLLMNSHFTKLYGSSSKG
jgi:hypothetical protein